MRDRTSQQWFDGPPNDYTRDLVGAVDAFTASCARHREPAPIPTHHLQQRYEALADRHDEVGLGPTAGCPTASRNSLHPTDQAPAEESPAGTKVSTPTRPTGLHQQTHERAPP
ncbi:hypothetical protein GCM10010269_15970 [Streptomyces humidus]|uniref:Uncharacterized protein n=1 Tax=Streptomyces humidus TaxID=52259 RepID=A0A918FT53_9ACTN|nr:hypothetical protein [Streptomyces humidus]GGR77512.1 hypothetical protein GCM10010269_15970 [Streptomyces humidus]